MFYGGVSLSGNERGGYLAVAAIVFYQDFSLISLKNITQIELYLIDLLLYT